MRSDEVAQYLQDNPAFFEEHAEMLSQINLPHPHGGRTISLSERQMLTLRERIRELEKKLHELLLFAKENDGLQNKMHRLACALVAAPTDADTQAYIAQQLRDIFAVPHVALRLWQATPPPPDVADFLTENPQPICTRHAVPGTTDWFGESAAQLRSYALLPLNHEGSCFGLLILASEDSERFYPEMGTLFLQHIADMLAALLHPRD